MVRCNAAINTKPRPEKTGSGLRRIYRPRSSMATAAEIAAVQAELDIAVAARTAIMQRGQEVQLNGRRITRANLGEVNKYISQVRLRLNRLKRGGAMRRAVPE